jgi:hypothetical protein
MGTKRLKKGPQDMTDSWLETKVGKAWKRLPLSKDKGDDGTSFGSSGGLNSIDPVAEWPGHEFQG